MTVCSELAALFERRGATAYFGEQVSMLEHSLQAAHFARVQQAPTALVVAALLHDIGHLLEDVPADINDWHVDAQHEAVGSDWLARHFGPDICEPVAMHVAAKRYLCASEPSYFAGLSAASVLTLRLQGGPMTTAEIQAFGGRRYCNDAVRLRRWDDQGKLSGFRAPGLEQYFDMIDSVCVARSGAM